MADYDGNIFKSLIHKSLILCFVFVVVASIGTILSLDGISKHYFSAGISNDCGDIQNENICKQTLFAAGYYCFWSGDGCGNTANVCSEIQTEDQCDCGVSNETPCHWSYKFSICTHTIVSCDQYNYNGDSDACNNNTSLGCHWDNNLNSCSDTPTSCNQITGETDCKTSSLLCTWGSTCNDAASCSDFQDQTVCESGGSFAPCYWSSGSSTCSDAPTNCSQIISGSACKASQFYCTWDSNHSECNSAQSCSDLQNETICYSGDGFAPCYWDSGSSTCSITPSSCGQITGENDCKTSSLGCSWSGSACSTATTCSDIQDSTICSSGNMSFTPCYWSSGPSGCSSDPSQCDQITGQTDCNASLLYCVWSSSCKIAHALTYLHGSNGTVTGSSSQKVADGANGSAVTAVPSTGYHFAKWSDDVITASRTDTNVQADISVTASFAADPVVDQNPNTVSGGATYYYINISAGENGLINPIGGYNYVIYGGNLTYNIIPNSGYQVADVLVDGVSVGSITNYTFNNVNSDHKISATFSAIAGNLTPGGQLLNQDIIDRISQILESLKQFASQFLQSPPVTQNTNNQIGLIQIMQNLLAVFKNFLATK